MRGDRERLVAHLDRCGVRRRTGDHRLPAVRAAPCRARWPAVIPGRHRQISKIAAELLRQRSAPASFACSAPSPPPGIDVYFSRRPDAHGHRLERPAAGALAVVGEADCRCSARLRARRAAALENRPAAGARQRIALAPRIVAAVEDHVLAAARVQLRGVRHLLGGNQIAPAHLRAIEFELDRNPVEQPFHRERTLRMAGAAYRRDRHLVGQRDLHVHPIRRHLILQRHGLGGVVREIDAACGVRAVIVDDAAAHTENARGVVYRDLDVPVLVALLRGRDEMLAAVFDPFDRAAFSSIAASAVTTSSG